MMTEVDTDITFSLSINNGGGRIDEDAKPYRSPINTKRHYQMDG